MMFYLTPSGTSDPGRKYRKGKIRVARFFASGIVLLFALISASQVIAGPANKSLALVLASDKVTAKQDPTKSKHHPRQNTFMKREWGVEVLFVRETSAGYMLEFRYKVLDADKAQPLFERQTKPVLTHTKSGATLIVPTPAKTGALRNSNKPKTGNTYWMFFANPGQLVKPGDKVNVAIGEFHADGIVVR